MSHHKKLRIITWNCPNRSVDQVIRLIEKKRPDILVIQEINEPVINSLNRYGFFQESSNKGVAIATFNGYTLEKYRIDTNEPIFFIPVKISGSILFHMLAVWAQLTPTYAKSIQTALNIYHNFLKSGPSVVLGDFNINSNWDDHYKKYNLPTMVEEFESEFDLVSSYHKKMESDQVSEEHPTLYWCWDENKKFHVDYCFVPKTWKIESVEVGSFEDWKEYSDHRPLIVDILVE